VQSSLPMDLAYLTSNPLVSYHQCTGAGPDC
jgi:hypothetical protein